MRMTNRYNLYRLCVICLLMVLGACAKPVKDAEFDHISIVKPGNTQDSFWYRQVEYGFTTSFAKVIDNNKQEWKIAYQDVYIGNGEKQDAKTVVLIHGRCANMGYYSKLITDLARNDYRVVAIDLPHYGKSLPGNLALPVERSLQDTRILVHRLLSQKLNLHRYHLYGHSMGGQWAIGYALSYPKAVSSLILESPYGLEDYPTSFSRKSDVPLRLFDPALANSWALWNEVWSPLGHLSYEMSRTEAEIRAAHYFKQVNQDTGALEEASSGLFLTYNQDSAFYTQARIQASVGNLAEYDRLISTCVRDIYAMGVETRDEDTASLSKRLTQLQTPVLMLFGEKDPFLPNTLLSGNVDRMKDYILPARAKMLAAGIPLTIVNYPDAAHVPHVDQAERLGKDVVAYLKSGNVLSQPL